MRRSLLLAIALALALPAAAYGHATLKHSTPAVQSSVETAPTEIRLRFDQSVTITSRSIEVFAADGTKVSGEAVSGDRGREISVPLPRGLTRGAYTVRWRELSSDGHVGSGVFTFGVGVPAPPPTEAVGASGLTWKDDAARWAYFAAFALLLGTLGMRLLVLRQDLPPALEKRLYLLAVIGGFAVIDVGILSFVLRSANALQVPFVDLMYGDLSPFATKTRFGTAFVTMTLGYALVTALVLLAWILDVPRLLWPAFLTGVGFASGLSFSGHQALEPNATWLSEVADWSHLVAASLWAGGVLSLAVCVWPLAPRLRSAAFLGFSRIAVVLVAVLVLAGTYMSIERLPTVADLWETAYGRALVLKLSIVGLALLWGAGHHFFVAPRLERGESPSILRRSLLGESTVAMAVLLAAAILVNSQPPPVEPADGVSASQASGHRP